MSQSHPVLRSSIHGDLVTLTYWPTTPGHGWSKRRSSPILYGAMMTLIATNYSGAQRLSENLKGVPESALISRSEHQRVDVGRSFPVSGYGDRRRATPQDEAKILALSTPEDIQQDALNCGQVLWTVLLDCTMAELATCTLTHITELEASRNIIQQTDRKTVIPTGFDPRGHCNVRCRCTP